MIRARLYRRTIASTLGWAAVGVALASAVTFGDCVPLAFAAFLAIQQLQHTGAGATDGRAAWSDAPVRAALAAIGLLAMIALSAGVIAKQSGWWVWVQGSAPDVMILLAASSTLALVSSWFGDARSHLPLVAIATIAALVVERAMALSVPLVACVFAISIATGLAAHTWRHAVNASRFARLQQRWL